MLQFFINTGSEITARLPFSRPFKVKSCAGFKTDSIPNTHIYVTSHSYAEKLNRSLRERSQQLQQLPPKYTVKLVTDANFPKSFRKLHFDAVSDLHDHIEKHCQRVQHPSFIVLDGFGSSLSDNFVGLGILQRFKTLLSPKQTKFSLMQELEEHVVPVYQNEPSIDVRSCFMPLNEFSQYDFFIDYSSAQQLAEYENTASARFISEVMSIKQLLPDRNIQPSIVSESEGRAYFERKLDQAFCNDLLTVFVNPRSSTLERKLPDSKFSELVQALSAQSFNVVSTMDLNNPPPRFLALSSHTNSLADLTNIISCVDAVISVGNVTYHMASALGKPTVLLPTIVSDIRAAHLMPEVLPWIPKGSLGLYTKPVKIAKTPSSTNIEKIWSNLDFSALIQSLGEHIQSFILTNSGRLKSPRCHRRVGVVIPCDAQSMKLRHCLDSICKTEMVDPLYIFPVRSVGLGKQHHRYASAFNQGIQQALTHDCDFIWLIHDNASVPKDYLRRMLRHFDEIPKLGILGSENTDSAGYRGNDTYAPLFKQKKTKLKGKIQRPWVSFESVLIRSSVFDSLDLLNTSMQRSFYDFDFCIRAAEKNWQTYLDQSVCVKFTDSASENTEVRLTELEKSEEAFISSWAAKLGTSHKDDIQQILIDYVDSL